MRTFASALGTCLDAKSLLHQAEIGREITVTQMMDQLRDRARLQQTRLRFMLLDTRDWWERARTRAAYQAEETLWITRRSLVAWAVTLFAAGGLAGGVVVAVLAPGGLVHSETARSGTPEQLRAHAHDPAANLSPIMATRPRPASTSAKPRTPIR